jgi:hypothetical protein
MLDRLAPLAHFFRVLVEPALDGFENMLMLPARDPSLLAGGTAVLDGAALAGVGPVAAQDQPVFLVRLVVGESFISRTDIDILVSHVAESCLPKRPSSSSTNTSITRTGLSSSIQSSRHSGNNVDCPRSTPSTKRFIATSPRKSRQNCIMRGVFTQVRRETGKE